MLKKALFLINFMTINLAVMAQTITPTYFKDDFSTAISGNVTYSTLYPLYYVSLTRNTTDERFEAEVEPKLNEWRPIVIGLSDANGGNGIDISAYPIMQVRVVVPSTTEIPGNNDLKLAFYISDNNYLGEYDFVSGEDFLESAITTGSDIVLTYNWKNALQVTNWAVWPPATACTAPNLKHIKQIGMSMNTNSTMNGTYYIKSIELGSQDNNPLANITTPTCGAQFVQGSNIPLTITNEYSLSDISSVSYYDGTTLINTVSSDPFSYDWSTASVGDHIIKAEVTFNDATTYESKSVKLKVNVATSLLSSTHQKVLFYPNPAQDVVHFNVPVETADLYDVTGMLILHQENTDAIPVEKLSEGCYFIKTEQGFYKLLIKR